MKEQQVGKTVDKMRDFLNNFSQEAVFRIRILIIGGHMYLDPGGKKEKKRYLKKETPFKEHCLFC